MPYFPLKSKVLSSSLVQNDRCTSFWKHEYKRENRIGKLVYFYTLHSPGYMILALFIQPHWTMPLVHWKWFTFLFLHSFCLLGTSLNFVLSFMLITSYNYWLMVTLLKWKCKHNVTMSDYPLSLVHIYSNFVTSMITTDHCNINDKYIKLKFKEMICNLCRDTKFFVNNDYSLIQWNWKLDTF